MTALVGVHGIWQQQLGRQQLRATWVPALADGLERACGHPVPPPPLDVVFYGNLFLTPTGGAKSGPGGDDSLLDGLGEDELADLTAAAMSVLTPHDWDAAEAAEALTGSKGYTRVPLALQRILRALDHRFGASAGVLYLGEVRQVRRYLCTPQIKQEVDDRVAAMVGPGTRILIGHSLGSVVALEHVRQHPDRQLDLLLTLGSPLGLSMIRARMPDPEYGMAVGRPPNVASWVNIRDPRDPVACAGGLRPWWSLVDDLEVDNQGDAHAAPRYLSKRATGHAVLAAAADLAHR